jgi:hypothetical protein
VVWQDQALQADPAFPCKCSSERPCITWWLYDEGEGRMTMTVMMTTLTTSMFVCSPVGGGLLPPRALAAPAPPRQRR